MLVTKNTKSIQSIGAETISSGSNCQKVLEENQSSVDFVNHDDLFTDENEAVGGDLRESFDTEIGMGEHEDTDIETHAASDATSILSTSPVQIHNQERAENLVTEDRKMSLILEMLDQISEMNNNLMLLRKQVARLELKSIGWPMGSDGRARLSLNSDGIDSDDLMNFEERLAREGLPLKTCVEVNDFEKKLRSDPEFRKKLVSHFN